MKIIDFLYVLMKWRVENFKRFLVTNYKRTFLFIDEGLNPALNLLSILCITESNSQSHNQFALRNNWWKEIKKRIPQTLAHNKRH